jgi:hypothetical protein
MSARRTHRILGLVLLLPICGWALTGFVFFVKPGYGAAYASLQVRKYPLANVPMPQPRPDWLEIKLARSVLGDHLLVRLESGPVQLDPLTMLPRDLPDEAAIRRLIVDAIGDERDRYGELLRVERNTGKSPSAWVETTTGVRIDLNWSTLTLQQRGRDTRRIDALYRIHYLQWTGFERVDRVLGVIGLAALVVLAAFGLRLAFRPSRRQ